MPEAAANRRPSLAAAAIALALALATGFGGAVALVAGALAQPALAFAVRGWREPRPFHRAALLRDARALLALWAGALALAGLLLAWPLASLLRGGGLGPVLALSAVAGLCVLGLWRTWPVWQGCALEGGPL